MIASETEHRLVEWRTAPVDYPVIPLHRYIEAHAAEQPAAIAATFAGEQLTYRELNRRANQLAHYLGEVGVGPEVRVAVCLKPSLEVAISLLAILKAGGVYTPFDPNDPAERTATLLADSQPRVILTNSYLTANLAAHARQRLVCLDHEQVRLDSFPTENPSNEIDFEQTAYLIYTSGTTGKPKGVMVSHRNLIHYILSAYDRYAFREQDVMPALARFTFSISLFELLSPLVAGGRLIILERDQVLNFHRMVKVLQEVTIIHASPAWWRKLLSYLLSHSWDTSQCQQIRHVSAGGDIVPGELLEKMKMLFPNAEVFVIYGCTEISCMGCTYPALRDQKTNQSWLGQPFSKVQVRLCDSEGRPVPAEGEGEIYVSGEGVTKGYLNLPQLTKEKFVVLDGRRFYRTGDFGRYVDRNLQMLGRVDFQIQLRGIRVEPEEIETHLRQAPGIREGLVAARELGTSEKSLIAYVVLETPGKLDLEAVRTFLRARLPDYLLPAAFVVLDAIPVNLNQKVDRQALSAPTSENVMRVESAMAPRDEDEKQLAEIWETALGVMPIDVQSSFFSLGGDSFQAIQILMQVEERWNLTLPITILLEADSIAALANVIRKGDVPSSGEERQPSHDVVPLQHGGNKSPLFCLQGVLLYQELAHSLDKAQPVHAVFLQEEIELIKAGQADRADSIFASIPALASRYLNSVRAKQSHGPYYLAGSSFAGLIAFEMARQLRKVGEEVALIALFDSMMIRKIGFQRRLQCHWKLFREQGVGYLTKKSRGRLEGMLQTAGILAHRPNRSLPLAPGASAADQETVLDEISARAAESYVPHRYFGKVVLFRATDQSFFNEDSPDLGWTPYAQGDFQIHNIPGNHLGILRGHSASILAQQLQLYLE